MNESYQNRMMLEFDARPENEGFARVAVASFLAVLDPTMEEMEDVKTAVSEAVTNAIIHGYGNYTGKAALSGHEIDAESEYGELSAIGEVESEPGTASVRKIGTGLENDIGEVESEPGTASVRKTGAGLENDIGEVESELGTASVRKIGTHMEIGSENRDKVVIRACISGRKITIRVIDYGAGIEDIEKAMEPMYTSKPEMDRSGMGFSFMEAFMDELDVISAPNEGTTVIMAKVIMEE